MIDKNWHLWFAWYPVKDLDGKWIWLTLVERRIVFSWTGDWMGNPVYRVPIRRGLS